MSDLKVNKLFSKQFAPGCPTPQNRVRFHFLGIKLLTYFGLVNRLTQTQPAKCFLLNRSASRRLKSRWAPQLSGDLSQNDERPLNDPDFSSLP